MPAYYNEVDPYAAQWLRNLVAAGHVSPGDVDERDIRDIRPADLSGYARCHFFAGIGVWDYALGLAGWPDDRPVWTGSCPCQPFSAAGRRAGFDDERHLWPVWFDLIRQCRPAIVLGEQVEAAVRLGWLDAVLSDLEGEGYACGATVFGAHSVGAPHIRQRLWFVADSDGQPRRLPEHAGRTTGAEAAGRRETRLVGDTCQPGSGRHAGAVPGSQGEGSGERCRVGRQPDEPVVAGAVGGLGHTNGHDAAQERASHDVVRGERTALGRRAVEQSGSAAASRDGDGLCPDRTARLAHGDDAYSTGHWSDPDWLPCRDGKARPVEPGTFPLAHGASARVGRLRAYGNAIVPQAAAAFIRACLDELP